MQVFLTNIPRHPVGLVQSQNAFIFHVNSFKHNLGIAIRNKIQNLSLLYVYSGIVSYLIPKPVCGWSEYHFSDFGNLLVLTKQTSKHLQTHWWFFAESSLVT